MKVTNVPKAVPHRRCGLEPSFTFRRREAKSISLCARLRTGSASRTRARATGKGGDSARRRERALRRTQPRTRGGQVARPKPWVDGACACAELPGCHDCGPRTRPESGRMRCTRRGCLSWPGRRELYTPEMKTRPFGLVQVRRHVAYWRALPCIRCGHM